MDMQLAHGPYRPLKEAQDAAYMLVDEPYTLWSIVELFGPEYNWSPSEGETFGELWVVPEHMTRQFAEDKGVEDYQVVDTYGYEHPDDR